MGTRPTDPGHRTGACSFAFLPLLIPFLLHAGDGGRIKIELTHSSKDCFHYNEWGCDARAHYRLRVDGGDLPDHDALFTALRKAARGHPQPSAADSGPTVFLSPDAKALYSLVWDVMNTCPKAGLHRFDWSLSQGAEEKPRRSDFASGGSASEIWIRIENRIRANEAQIEDGPWISDDQEFLDALGAARADGDTTAVLDPEGGLPWSEISSRIALCGRLGIKRIEFLGLPALPPGYSDRVTEEESAALARSLDQAQARDQPHLLDRLIDRQEMMRRMTGTRPLSVLMRHQLASMFIPGIPSGKHLRAAADGQRTLRLLKGNLSGRTVRPLFRMLAGTYLNYVEIILARRPDGEIRIVDLFDLSQGALQTEAGRSNFVPPDPWILKKLNSLKAPTPSDLIFDTSPVYREMMELVWKEKNREVVDLFRKQADLFRTNRRAHVVHVNVARRVGADAYAIAVSELERHFPGDPSLLLLKLESASMKRDLNGVLEAAEALDARLQGDPYLNLVRASAHLIANDPAKARACAEKATQAEPDLSQGWWTLVSVCLGQNDFKTVARILSKLEEELKVEIGDLEAAPAYAEFVKSREYGLWLESRKK